MKELGYGSEYQYAHSFDNNFAMQEYLPEKLKGTKFYEPGNNNKEKELLLFLRERWKGKYDY
jgi:putative ATPase